jgi:hypothetical protein
MLEETYTMLIIPGMRKLIAVIIHGMWNAMFWQSISSTIATII